MDKVWRFYGASHDWPLSRANNTPAWETSMLGELYRESGGSVFIYEIEGAGLSAKYGWRVVDARYSTEDSTMTKFMALGLDGEFLGDAVFGVNGGHDDQISGGFQYPNRFGNKYYVPRDQQIVTVKGGQSVQVLDYGNPSEVMAFSLISTGSTSHQCLDIIFRLSELGEGYPNDWATG